MSDTTMRAALITGPKRAEVQRVPIPMPDPRQVRVRIEGCGVCGSNLALWEGRPWFEYPRESGAPGHEAWGYIDAVGELVPEPALGQRVAVLSYRAFAEYDVADAAHVVPLPAALGAQPFPGEALGCALNIYRRAGVRAGQHVAVIGTGFLGLLLVQLAARDGAIPIAVSRRAYALKLAERMGARFTLTFDDRSRVVAQVMEITHGNGCEVAIEAVGEQAPLDLASELMAERGRLVIAGYHQDPRQVNMQQWNWRGLDVINAHERDPAQYLRGIRDAVDAVASGKLTPEPLYTHEFGLHELGRALSGLYERPDGMLKTWVRP